MTRRERYARSEFAPWPDEGLCEAARTLVWPWIIWRSELRHHDAKTLTVEVADADFRPAGDLSVPADEWPRFHSRVLRLTWENRWEGQIHQSDQIFALESYDEFYASGPLLAAHESHNLVQPGLFMEIVSDPDPWIEQMLAQNGNTDMFPPYGVPALMSERTRAQNPELRETGRFFPADAPLADGGSVPLYVWTGETEATPEERAEFAAEVERVREQKRQSMVAQPRYRHLLIVSESHYLEILCESLPRWEWVTVTAEQE